MWKEAQEIQGIGIVDALGVVEVEGCVEGGVAGGWV